MSAKGLTPRWEIWESSDGKRHDIKDSLTGFTLSFNTDDVTSAGFKQLKRMAWAIVDLLNATDTLPKKCNSVA